MRFYQTFSEAGGHPTNEDFFSIESHPLDSDLLICFLADGQGGQSGGGAAAEMACRVGMRAAQAIQPDLLHEPRSWNSILHQVDRAVMLDPVAGYTTLIGLMISPHAIVGASTGDSAAWLIHSAGILELTAQQHKHPAIGSGAILAVPFIERIQPSDRLLIATDGVWKFVGKERITEIASQHPAKEWIDLLQQQGRLPSNNRFQDDFTILLIDGVTE